MKRFELIRSIVKGFTMRMWNIKEKTTNLQITPRLYLVKMRHHNGLKEILFFVTSRDCFQVTHTVTGELNFLLWMYLTPTNISCKRREDYCLYYLIVHHLSQSNNFSSISLELLRCASKFLFRMLLFDTITALLFINHCETCLLNLTMVLIGSV